MISSLRTLGFSSILAALGLLGLNWTPTSISAEPGKPAVAVKLQYNRDIRPILSENCFACHGPDSASRKAGLRLDQRDAAIAKEAFKPGRSTESEMIARILLPETDEGLMPPVKSHKKLTPKQKETLKNWIGQGAEYELHWSFLAPKKPAVPTVKDTKAVRNPIDAFVLAELEKKGLTFAPEADRRSIARRLALDTTGLPPKVEDVEEFVNDKAADAYEKYVSKMLASPQWGEHRGRHWLDAARYADTHGIHFDNFRENWAYREWVINAFNQNMTFDRFTTEQLAGDLLPNPTTDQLVATGFNRCNITTNEGGAISEEYLVLYNRDRTETVSQTWLGLTAGCAVCHDHKFDPFSAKDFYSLAAFFNNTTQAAMDGNIRNTPPVINVPKLEDRAKWDSIGKDVTAAKTKLDARKTEAKLDFSTWAKAAKPFELAGKIPTEGLVFHAPLTEGEGQSIGATAGGKTLKVDFKEGYDWSLTRAGQKVFTVKPGASVELPGVGDFEKGQGFSVSTWVSIDAKGKNGALLARMDEGNIFRGWDVWIQNDRIGTHIINAWPADAIKVVAKKVLEPKKWYHVTVSWDGTPKTTGVKIYLDGEVQPFDIESDTLKSTIRTTVPFKIGQRSSGTGRLSGVGIQDLRLFDRGLTGVEAQQLAGSTRTAELLAKSAEKRTPQETDELFNWWLVSQDANYKNLANEHRKLVAEEATIKARGTVAHISVEKKTPPEAYILKRGDYDKRGEKVGANTPSALPPFKDLPQNRLGFAQWLLKADHPLTSRVNVNRFWQEIFGNGLVKSSGDFGVTGDMPSHPELLDWLALEFQSKWDVKEFFRTIFLSATYRQAATTTKEKLDKDPFNRFLSRGPRYRMDGEMIRDGALAASGIMVPKIGGPSVKPYQPDGVWEAVAMPGSDTRDYRRDTGENLYRRSMYTFWKRAAPPASMEIFNAPNRETCTVKRERTNTPLQALVTLNDIQFIEAARMLAEKAIGSGPTDEARIEFIAKRLLSRSFRTDEIAIVKESLTALMAGYKAKPLEAKKLLGVGDTKVTETIDPATFAAWTMLCNQLMNLDEFLTK